MLLFFIKILFKTTRHVSITFLVNGQNTWCKELNLGRISLDSRFRGCSSSRQKGSAVEGLGAVPIGVCGSACLQLCKIGSKVIVA